MMRLFAVQTAVLIVTYHLSQTTSNINFGTIHDVGRLVWNQRLRSTYLQFHPRSLLDCAIECLVRNGRCKSINHNPQLLFCELNTKSHSDDEDYDKSEDFHCSDIKTWPQSLAGKCQHKDCKENESCNTETGNCSVSDCGPIDFEIPENSVLQNVGHHEVGNAVSISCKRGYFMHDKVTGKRQYDGLIRCNASGYWEDMNFICLECDNNKLVIDSQARLLTNYSSAKNQTFLFRCPTGYNVFKDGKLDGRNVNVTCNKKRSSWEGANFFCKNSKYMVKDFCKQGYTYNDENEVCYKFHQEKLPQRAAQEACIREHAHLINPRYSYTTEFLQHYSGNESFYVDGVWDLAAHSLKRWANNFIPNKDILTFHGKANDTCISVKYGKFQFTNCKMQQAFMCQFEVCPETAGYIYSVYKDVCYRYFFARTHVSDKCANSFNSKTPDFPDNIPYNPKVLQPETWSKKQMYQNLLIHQNTNLRGREAYHVFLSRLPYFHAKTICKKNNMSLAKLDTAAQKDVALNIIRDRTSTVIVGMRLSNEETYKFQHTDGTPVLYIPNNILTKTDKKSCITINRHAYYYSMKCDNQRPFICADSATGVNIKLVESEKTYEEAEEHCSELKKTLLKIPSKNVLTKVKSQIQNKRSSYFINMKLAYKPNYVYQWQLGGTVLGTRDDFMEGYTNDTKDANPFVLFNVTSGMFELIDQNYESPFICQAINVSVWFDGEDDHGNPYSMNLQNWKTAPVDKKNKLPFICEIDTNDLIQKLNLSKKKPAISVPFTMN